MNAKQIKFYEIMQDFFSSDMLKQANVDKYFNELLKLDYAAAEDLWEYLLTVRDKELKDASVSALYADGIFELFLSSNQSRALKTVIDRPVISRAVFSFSAHAAEGELFALPVNLLVSGKADAVDAVFKLVGKNEVMGVSFGGYMVKFLDRFFIEMMKKSSQRRVELNRKQSALLLATVQRVKGDERAMLIQRVKEVQ